MAFRVVCGTYKDPLATAFGSATASPFFFGKQKDMIGFIHLNIWVIVFQYRATTIQDKNNQQCIHLHIYIYIYICIYIYGMCIYIYFV